MIIDWPSWLGSSQLMWWFIWSCVCCCGQRLHRASEPACLLTTDTVLPAHGFDFFPCPCSAYYSRLLMFLSFLSVFLSITRQPYPVTMHKQCCILELIFTSVFSALVTPNYTQFEFLLSSLDVNANKILHWVHQGISCTRCGSQVVKYCLQKIIREFGWIVGRSMFLWRTCLVGGC